MTVIHFNPGTPPPAPIAQSRSVSRRQDAGTVGNPEQQSFRTELDSRVRPNGLTFSRHAMKRLQMRGIEFTRDGLRRIEVAMDKLASKGSRDALVVAGPLSLVVSVDNRTVVTVMNSDNMQESVVTNIDSAVFA